MSETTAVAEGPVGQPKRRFGGWFSRMSLRGRLSLLTAAAVAVAIAVSAFSCYFIVRGQLYDQVHQNLASVRVGSEVFVHNSYCATSAASAAAKSVAATNSNTSGQPTPPNRWDMQLVLTSGDSAGQVCVLAQSTRGINTVASDASVAAGDTLYRSGSYTDGVAAEVKVTGDSGAYVLTAVPLTQVQDSLQKLLLILACVAAGGILGAAGIGLWVARAALKPVDRLTEAVEHIARTEELGTTIAVSGKDEIARLSESFNSMSMALAKSRDRQSQLIADAGHELRTPLTSLRTNVDLLVRSEETGRALPEATRNRMLGNMKAQMVELSTLIVDLLELSRPSRPKGSKPLEVLPLHDIAARALDRARLRGPGLVFNVELRPWYVRADAHSMERAVINLLDNAVKFSPPGGSIDVQLRFGTLTVRDHGPGIPAEDLPHVFDRFWRSPSARQMPGSGLGLAIVAQTIRDAGGEVSLAAAAPGPDGSTGGALATVQLPGAPTPPPPTPPKVGIDHQLEPHTPA
ncbi:two-component system sensor histidine kinase MprB [Streptomyces sp. 846.5]|nr:two-component system sensor histidine kinase MprB [Streptomyces sp. 846.5]